MIVLGIDPGTTRMGYAIVEYHQSQIKKVHTLGCFDLSKISEHPEKLKEIYKFVISLISQYYPQVMAIESPFYGKNVQSMLKLGRAQGVAIAAAFEKNLEVIEYPPKTIKLSITGNGNASKEQVLAMLKHLVEFEYNEKFLDATDALAAAVCYCLQKKSPVKPTIKKSSSKKQKNSWKHFVEKKPERKL